jgi:hypothetical protein
MNVARFVLATASAGARSRNQSITLPMQTCYVLGELAAFKLLDRSYTRYNTGAFKRASRQMKGGIGE